MKAYLIGERSAGMTAVEIFDDEGALKWSARWFEDGCTAPGLVLGLRDAFACMKECEYASDFGGGEYDEDGDPVPMNTEQETGVMLEYDSIKGVWGAPEDFRRYGQSSELVDALTVLGYVQGDGECDPDDPGIATLVRHIELEIAAINERASHV